MRRSPLEAVRAALVPPVAIGLLFTSVVVGVVSAQGTNVYTACLDTKAGTLLGVAVGPNPLVACKKGSQQVSWNESGPAGPPGPAGGATRVVLPLWNNQAGSWFQFPQYAQCGPGWITLGVCPEAPVASEFLSGFNFSRADYPADVSVMFTVTILLGPGQQYCVRLYNLAAGEAIPNSTICQSQPIRAFVRLGVEVDLSTVDPGDVIAIQEDNVDGYWDEQTFMFISSGQLVRADLDIDW